ncbi:MAG: glycogen/starch/alpha-glucan phosphorylase [Eubacteriales bacterium]|nr:glycogen/starch/alpha-glucan phosphorylase [Eubacteriales bacterium]
MSNQIDKETIKRVIRDNVKMLFKTTVEAADEQQIYQATAYAAKDFIIDRWMATHNAATNKKVLYYMSMEFLIGRLLGNNIINLCCFDAFREALEELGFDLNAIEDKERDPALGNGGLGRLAACFLESLSTLGYPAYGCGIRYRYGMFKQKIENGAQVEVPDNWLKNGYPLEIRRNDYVYDVKFGGYVRIERDPETGRDRFIQENYQSVRAVAYDLPIVGYGNNVVNALRVWDAEPLQEFELSSFESGNYHKAIEQETLAKTIVEVLYPNDNHYHGKELRLKQQYFFVSATLQRAIARHIKQDGDIRNLPQSAVFHMNDTHPTVTVPELMRLLMDEHGLSWDEAWSVTNACCAYTNHTIMAEALEKWPVDLFARLLPRVYQIVEEINRRFVREIEDRYPNDYEKIKQMAILYEGQVRMPNLAIVSSYSVNGVARLHTDILKEHIFSDYYQMMPEKFNNKTNGVTHRRFVLHANPGLAELITDKIGTDWITDFSEISKMEAFSDDQETLDRFRAVKRANKERLAAYIKEHNGIDVNPDAIFDVQVKRLHEYKRQTLNIMHIMYLYNRLKSDATFDMLPRVFIFGAKAAAGYERAKEIIQLINGVANVVNHDERIGGKLKVVFIEDYRVSNAEIIFAAADVSEQISTASHEASGTGNMKMMMNGAVTVGTMDGANIEIVEAAGTDNAYIFGLSSKEVIRYEQNGGYFPEDVYKNNEDIAKVLDQMLDGSFAEGDKERFRKLHESLIGKDRYFNLQDFDAYRKVQERIDRDFRDPDKMAKKMFLNMARSGRFNSDRTIREYVEDIWHLEPITPVIVQED